jgi:hypothetical protein
MDSAELNDFLKSKLLDPAFSANKVISSEELDHKLQIARAKFIQSEPISTENFDVKELDGVPIFAADDVAIYALSLPAGTDFREIVSSMAPPFNKFFIEFQNIPNQRIKKHEDKLHAWGALITVEDNPANIQYFEDDDGKPRWILQMSTFIEMQKGKPIGPVGHGYAGLAEDGTWFRHSDGAVWWAGGPAKYNIDEEPPAETLKSFGNYQAQLLFPALLTISFLHCKNIEIRTITPSEKLSKKYKKIMALIWSDITCWKSALLNVCSINTELVL